MGGVGTAGSALLSAWSARSVPDGARWVIRSRAPPGITINNVSVTTLSIAEHRQRPWVDRPDLLERRDGAGASGWDRGRRGCLWSAGHRLLGDRAAVCRQSECVWPGEIELSSLTVYAAEAQGPSITPVADPPACGTTPETGEWIWNAPGDPWPLPVSGTDSSGVCSLSVQAGAGEPIADPVTDRTEQLELAGVPAASELDSGSGHARVRQRFGAATRDAPGDERGGTRRARRCQRR